MLLAECSQKSDTETVWSWSSAHRKVIPRLRALGRVLTENGYGDCVLLVEYSQKRGTETKCSWLSAHRKGVGRLCALG